MRQRSWSVGAGLGEEWRLGGGQMGKKKKWIQKKILLLPCIFIYLLIYGTAFPCAVRSDVRVEAYGLILHLELGRLLQQC